LVDYLAWLPVQHERPIPSVGACLTNAKLRRNSLWACAAPAVGGANLPPRIPVADPVESALDFGKASLDHRLELAIGENVGPVVLDSFAHELARY